MRDLRDGSEGVGVPKGDDIENRQPLQPISQGSGGRCQGKIYQAFAPCAVPPTERRTVCEACCGRRQIYPANAAEDGGLSVCI